jgi:hypothetical protein
MRVLCGRPDRVIQPPMRKFPLLLVLVALMLVGASADAQRAQFQQQPRSTQTPQRGRQRNNGQFNRPPRNTGNFAFVARSFPAEYSILLRRTLFARDHVVPDVDPQPSRTSTTRRTEYIFRGTMVEGGTKFLAGIENRSSNRTLFYSEGGSVSGPNVRVTQITLDHIIVSDRNGRRMILIGEALDAGKAVGTSPTTLPAIANGPRPTEDSQ